MTDHLQNLRHRLIEASDEKEEADEQGWEALDLEMTILRCRIFDLVAESGKDPDDVLELYEMPSDADWLMYKDWQAQSGQ